MSSRQTRVLDLPRTDLRRAHGRGLDGYFWRLSDPAGRRVIVVFCGVNHPRAGRPWGNVGIAAHPNRALAAADLDHARAALDSYEVELGTHGADPAGATMLSADDGRLTVRVGSDAALEVELEGRRDWARPWLGGVGAAQLVPGLAHYWHPHLLGARVRGAARLGGHSLDLSGWTAYGEHTWGRGGFPPRWWWGQAHGFTDSERVLAFAGGTVARSLPRLAATAVVLSCGRRTISFGNPLRAPVRAEVVPGRWLLRGRTPGWQIDVEAEADLDGDDLHVLPVPDVEARGSAPAARQHLAGQVEVTLRHRGRVVVSDRSELAGLESGGPSS